MPNNFRIALRFLTARRRSMLMSLAGIVFGVGFFIVTQAQTSGFEGFFIRTIIGTNGAIRIEDKYQDMTLAMPADPKAQGPGQFEVSTAREGRRYIEGVENPDDIIAALRNFANVSGASLVVRGSVVADSSFRNDTAQVFGVRLEDHLAVSDLARQIVLGSLADYRETTHGLLIGRVLADRLKVTVGDALTLASGEQRVRFRVSAIYETGVSDIDRVRLYVHLTAARSLLRRASGASFIQVGLFDHTRAPLDVPRMEEVFRHGATSWQEREKTWL
ncbi:MAG: ABC transporter permease, partial [Opitutus sp.]|nr:ABC transporter permease [Opitutus sp.]